MSEQKYPVTVREMDIIARQIGLTTGYNDAAMKKIALINRLGFSVNMEMYERELRNTLEVAERRAEQARQAAEAAEIDEWLDSMTDEQISFIAWCADVDAVMADDADLHATQDNARL